MNLLRSLAALLPVLCPSLAFAGTTDNATGLRLTLALPKTVFHQGEALPASIEAANVGTTQPVAASFCANFGFGYENVTTKIAGFTAFQPPSCGGDASQDNDRALEQGHPLVLDLKDIGLTLKPGRYRLMSSWNASVAGKETAIFGPRYGVVGSNIVDITILP